MLDLAMGCRVCRAGDFGYGRRHTPHQSGEDVQGLSAAWVRFHHALILHQLEEFCSRDPAVTVGILRETIRELRNSLGVTPTTRRKTWAKFDGTGSGNPARRSMERSSAG
jgi:hypothetical protein